jgi:K+-dependent Na+/Ca+ exchanger related-protein
VIVEIIVIIIGFVLLVYGAERLVKGCSNIATKFNIPEIIIGLTIVAIGTSMPELIITITSAIKNHTDLIVGNAIGSDICNFLFILGFISIFSPVIIDKETRKIHLPAAIISTIMLLIMANGVLGTGKFIITRHEGIILLIFGVAYFSYPIYSEIKNIIQTSKNKNEETDDKKKIKVLQSVIFIIIGIVLLFFGSEFVVTSSTSLAEYFGISQSIIGLTVIAIGTALPEIVTSIVALIKKDTDMAVRKFNWFICS